MDDFLIPKEKLIDAMNRPLTLGLFYESDTNDFAVYTLKDHDIERKGQKYYSLKRLYLECEDPTEYSFIQQHLYNVKQWERICANTSLNPYVDEWRKELDMKLASSAIQGILEIATDEMASGQLQALKFFAKEEYKPKAKKASKKASEKPKDVFDYSNSIVNLKERMKRIK